MEKLDSYKKYDVILVDFGNAEFVGEQGGRRPAVVVQNNIGNSHSETTIVLPFTSKIKKTMQPTHSLFTRNTGGLNEDSVLLGECIRQISKERILCKIGNINDANNQRKVKKAYEANFIEDGDVY